MKKQRVTTTASAFSGDKSVFKVVLSLVVLAGGAALGVIAWLIWPAPSVEIDWEPMADQLIADEECYKVFALIGTFGWADPIGYHQVLDNVIQSSVCAIPVDSTNSTDRYVLDSFYPLSDEILTVLAPVPWWVGVKTATNSWLDLRWYRQEVGLGFAGWTDAVSIFRCQRSLGHFPAGHWLVARDGLVDTLHELGSGFIAPYDERRARCIAHVRSEYESIVAYAGGDRVEDEILQQLIYDYEIIFYTLLGDLEKN